MSKVLGRKLNIGFGKETVRGTAVAPAVWIPKLDFSFDEKFETVKDESSFGVIATPNDSLIVKKWAEGAFGGNLTDKSVGYILLALFGSVSSALKGGETVVYNHTFSEDQSAQHQALTIGVDDPNSDYQFALAMIDSFEIKYERGKILSYTVNFKSKKGASATLTASYTAENAFLPQHFAFKLADTLAGLDAAQAVKIKSLSLKVDKKLIFDDVLGSIEPNDICNTEFLINGSVDALFEDETTFKTIALGDTAKAMRIDLTHTATIGTSSNPKIKIDLAKVKFTDWSRNKPNNDLISQSVAFEAMHDLTTAKQAEVVLTNLQAAY